MAKYRKKPVVIEAVRMPQKDWSPVLRANRMAEIENHMKGAKARWKGSSLFIQTLEGEMEARAGDWIIKGVNGEFYPCKPGIFEKTYEEAV